MFFQVDHLTLYRYSVPVQLGPHTLRFLPLQSPNQQPGRCDLLIDPLPTHREEGIDHWGNRVVWLDFQGESEKLEIRAQIEAQTWDPTAAPSPPYLDESANLAPYLQPLEESTALQDFVQPLATAAMGNNMDFLHGLNLAVNRLYYQGVRVDGPPRTPAETLARGEGVCRDLTVLFMAACRQQGLAARFVSGYQQGDGQRQIRYLHAWPEVYVPGSGWHGFDPTHATLVGPEHLAVAAGPTPESVTPVEGSYCFSGPQLNSTLDVEIYISTQG